MSRRRFLNPGEEEEEQEEEEETKVSASHQPGRGGGEAALELGLGDQPLLRRLSGRPVTAEHLTGP